MSRKQDADQFLKLIEDCFVSKPILRKKPDNFEKIQQNYEKLFYSKYDQNITNEIGKDFCFLDILILKILFIILLEIS